MTVYSGKDIRGLKMATNSNNTTTDVNPYKILLINPNTSESMTEDALTMVSQSISPDTQVYGYTAPTGTGPTAIEGHLDGVLSSASVFRDVYDYVKQADACLVACFSDHPLINCLREEFDVPVCGILEAAVYSARLLGGRFGILTTSARSQIRHADAVRNMGLEGFCAGLLSTGLTVPQLETSPKERVFSMMNKLAQTLVNEKGADVLILGCCGMSDMQKSIEQAVGCYGVPVIDGVVAGVNLLSGIVRSKQFTSKRGVFASSKDSRIARGQKYI